MLGGFSDSYGSESSAVGFPVVLLLIKTRFAYAFGLMLFMAILIATVRYQAGTRPDDYDPELKQPSAADDAQEFQV